MAGPDERQSPEAELTLSYAGRWSVPRRRASLESYTCNRINYAHVHSLPYNYEASTLARASKLRLYNFSQTPRFESQINDNANFSLNQWSRLS